MAYLGTMRQSSQTLRHALAKLTPLPAEIHKRYFLETLDPLEMRKMAAVEVNLDPRTEHQVCLVCQRLLSFHVLENGYLGRAHVEHVLERLKQHRKPDAVHVYGNSAHDVLELAQRAILLSQRRVSRLAAEAATPRVLSSLEHARLLLTGPATLAHARKSLQPNVLQLVDSCPRCRVRVVSPQPQLLPPFHFECRCFRVAWRCCETEELERQVTLWALMAQLGVRHKASQFPLEAFIEACETPGLLSGQRNVSEDSAGDSKFGQVVTRGTADAYRSKSLTGYPHQNSKRRVVLFGLDDGLREALFDSVPQGPCVWVGEVFPLSAEQELIPLRFGHQDFLVGFSTPVVEAGGDAESLQTMSAAWASGYAPAEHSRIVKFCRAEAGENAFQPDDWHLDAPEQIFQLSQAVADAVVYHAENYPTCSQYFYWAANEALELLYKRAFRYIDRTCLPGAFQPILANIGDFNGYQRAQAV